MSETNLTVKVDSQAARKMHLRRIASTAILSAMAAILMFLEIRPSLILLPFPDFLAFDFSEIPVRIGTFALGPVWGVVIELIKNLLEYFFIRIRFCKQCHTRTELKIIRISHNRGSII